MIIEKHYTQSDCIEIAKYLMEIISYDNGCVDRWCPMKYDQKYIDKISTALYPCINKYPRINNNVFWEQFCNGSL